MEAPPIEDAQVSIDEEVFARAVSIFATKREAFAANAVEVLASDIVRRLALAHPGARPIETADIAEESIEAFCDVLIQPAPEAALKFIQDRRAEGVTRRGVYLGYIVGAARCLGRRWDEDRASFLEVTVGTGHLYALMRAMRAEGHGAQPDTDTRRSALFATVPGEDHGIGVTVAADLFREAGWEIELRIASDHDELVTLVEASQAAVIGLSFSTEQRLEALVRLVVAIRLVVPNAIVGVAPPATMTVDRLHGLVDIDLVFEDASSSRVAMDRLIRLRR